VNQPKPEKKKKTVETPQRTHTLVETITPVEQKPKLKVLKDKVRTLKKDKG
jgi:hypothetical protein